nr:AAC_HP1_G0006690.mRNA.1.CDS.1 [Saccharomyces cerevisiae]
MEPLDLSLSTGMASEQTIGYTRGWRSPGSYFCRWNAVSRNHNSRTGFRDQEPLWTTNAEYATTNPFDFEFELRRMPLLMKRMKERDPEFIESYIYGETYMTEEEEHAMWIDDDIVAPNITDRGTVVSLALMSSNAYVRIPQTGDWRNVTEPWNETEPEDFGWDGDGIRGHVFYNEVENIVVLSIKGTSAQGLPGSGEDETTRNDKINDNFVIFVLLCKSELPVDYRVRLLCEVVYMR